MDTGYLAGHQQRLITDRPYQYQPRNINLKIITIEMNPNCWDSSDVTILNGSMKFHCNLQLAKLDLLDLGCRIPSGILRQYVHVAKQKLQKYFEARFVPKDISVRNFFTHILA